MRNLKDIEKRFLEVANLEGDLTQYPLTQSTHLQVKTDKNKSNSFGEVFTPLWLVDEMLDKITRMPKTTLDMCAGYGQFTIRLMRKKKNMARVNKKAFNIEKFLTENHSFNELQISSCLKLLYIFGKNINLFIGDSRRLKEIDENDYGIMYYSEANKRWIDISDRFLILYDEVYKFGKKIDKEFEDDFENYILKKSSKSLESFMVF